MWLGNKRWLEFLNKNTKMIRDPWFEGVGIGLAVTSGLFIGTSLVLQKKGLIETVQSAEQNASIFRSAYWWVGIFFLALGEVFNFMAYAFSPAILVTPLGAVSVVVSAILSVIFLKERINFSGTLLIFDHTSL